MVKYAVTGGTGFIATSLIARLLTDGHEVVATLRNPDREAELRSNLDYWSISHTRLSVRVADLDSDYGWDDALKGCVGVFHVASPIPAVNTKRDDALTATARDGALRVLTAAVAAGAKRVVMTSSIAAMCYGNPSKNRGQVLFDESDWSDIESKNDIDSYAISKTEAERAAWNFAAIHPELELVAINPGVVLGPLPLSDPGISALIIAKLLEGGLPIIPPAGFEVVDIRDVVDLEVAAMTSSVAPGNRYVCTSEYATFRQICETLRKYLGANAKLVPKFQPPVWLTRFGALFNAQTRGLSNAIGKTRKFSNQKAKTELGWNPRPANESILATACDLLQRA